ncbi:plasma membrane fusion protein prm1 [Lasallia pustulata]|uniref:Plasma membrane fusion protein PRM1 n=1 Tax=Lasallia pustulata TaxID=136370 RepID=A0A1W5CVC3_9LECA|nr:plasma membrane fusion protein prm1 [Lasallia pustulata]
MSSATNHNISTFPAVPPSLSAGDHGMRDYYAAQDTSRPSPYTAPDITPYLGLRARLSQVWINRWTILLLLVLVRTLIAISGLHYDLDSAKTQALSACSGVEDMGSAMASMPHYMSQGVNELTAHGVDKAVNGLMSMLLLSITGVEEIVVFYINMLTSTYVCLITLAVSGSLHVALKVIEDASNFLNQTLGSIGHDLSTGVDDFVKDLNKFTSALDSIPKILGSPGSIPTINVNSTLDALNHVALPSGLDEGLAKMNASIPDFAQVNNFTNNAIRFPFEEVKKLINTSITTFHMNRSLFPVPRKEQLTFCSDNDGIATFFDELSHIANLARKIFVVVLLIAAILACIPMAYREIMRWRTMQKRAQLVGQNAVDKMDVVYIASRPYTSGAGIKAAAKFKSTKKQLLTRWVIAYSTSAPALFVLSLGLAGLFACLCQYTILKAIEKEAPALEQEVGDFAGKVVNALNNASEQWAIGTNHAITTTNDDINKDVFGWVNTTTGALNDTLNVFVDGMTDALNVTFGGTVLYDPIMEVMNCLIGLKIAGIQKGLDWVSDNAKVEFPTLPNDTFSLGAAASIASNNSNASESFLASPGSEATDKITSAVNTMTTHLADAIQTEAIISTFVVLLWVMIVLLGLFRALFLSFKRDKHRGEGGPSTAGDIPMEDQRPHSPAAPAYEPPREPRTFPTFGARTPNVREESSDHETEWQDRKLGFAGARALTPEAVRAGVLRSSSYGHVVNEKR